MAGAVLGTLPDLDIFIDFGDAVRNFTYHRGFSHSLLVLPGVAFLIWLALRRWWAPVRGAPRHWLAAIVLALVTHPLLDAHTAYGTQLLWPFEPPPVSWATMFIIDPAYTLPLLIGLAAVAAWPARAVAKNVLVTGLALSVVYLGWTWVGKTTAEREARHALAAAGIEYRAIFSTPTPLNSLLWRVVVMTDDGYLEGFDSVVIDEGTMRFARHPSDLKALSDASDVWAVQRLRWFADDFIRADVVEGQLVITDLRMGQDPYYVFRHVVAAHGNPHWTPIEPQRLVVSFDRLDLGATWRRIWNPQERARSETR